MKKFETHILESTVKESIEYHTQNNIPVSECIFRPHSEGFYQFYVEARKQFANGTLTVESFLDKELLSTDIGERVEVDGEVFPLDIPLLEEKDVELNSPKRGGDKKFYVYVRDPKTKNIKKISFGDTTGLTAKINDPAARKSFAARHNCDQKKDKTKAGYWSCRLPYYAKQLGLSGGGNYFW